MPVRHLRRLYRDPITGQDEWGLVEAPGGGVMGVYSRSEDEPIKSGNFSDRAIRSSPKRRSTRTGSSSMLRRASRLRALKKPAPK